MGDGESIRLWDDPWLSFTSPKQPVGLATMEHAPLKVTDLLCPLTNKWQVEKIRRILPQYEDDILRIKTSSTLARDKLLWLPEKSGLYSTKTGYGLAIIADKPVTEANNPVNWLKHVWNVKTAPKIKDFLWRVMKHAIPVSSNLERRGVLRFNCKTCGEHEDDLHVFLKCPLAEDVWCNMPITVRPLCSVSSVAEMFKQGDTFLPLPSVGLNAPSWPWVVWNLWKARNKFAFENIAFTAQEIILKSIKDAREWSNAQVGNRATVASNASSPLPHRRDICPPPTFQPGILVCKVDASWDSNSGRCGIGGIFSGDNTVMLPIFSEAHNHVSSALMA